jgi:hypothetical protein
MGLRHSTHPRGYDNYEIGLPPGYQQELPEPAGPAIDPSSVAAQTRAFPAIDRLASELAAPRAGTPIVILFPPRYYSELPRDAASAATFKGCKERLARLARGSGGGEFLDFFVDSEMVRDKRNFDDVEHYREPVARRIEMAIAGVLDGRSAQTR